MNTYFIKTNYSATGEGMTTFIAFGIAVDVDDFINKCKKDIDPYYLMNIELDFEKNLTGDIFCAVENIPQRVIEYLQKDLPILHRIIEGKVYLNGNVWFVQKLHINLS
jgi:hypothetical protein